MNGRWTLFAALVIVATLLAVSCGPAAAPTPTSVPEAPAAAPTATVAAPAPAPTATPTATPVPAPKRGGIIRAVNEGGINTFDAHFTSSYAVKNPGNMIYERLLDYDMNDFRIKPQMADWQASADGLVWTFTLREGLTWHDGKPVTTADVLATMERFNTNPQCTPTATCGRIYAQMASREAVNDRVFRITLKRPVPIFLELFAGKGGTTLHILPKEAVLLTKTDAKVNLITVTDKVVGSGAYSLKKWVQGDRQELARYEAYVSRKEPASSQTGAHYAYADEIHILEVPDLTTRISGLEAGQFDFVHEISSDFLKRLTDNKKLQVFKPRPGINLFFWPNHENPPTDNWEILAGLLQSRNDEQAMLAAGGSKEYYEVCYSTVTWCRDTLAGIDWKELVKDLYPVQKGGDPKGGYERAVKAGYKGEEIVVLHAEDVPMVASMLRIFVQNWKDAGFNINHRIMDDVGVKQVRAAKTGWNIVLATGKAHNTPTGRPTFSSGGVPRFHPNQRQSELGDLLFFETDPKKQLELLKEYERLRWTDGGGSYPTAGYIDLLQAGSARLKGYEPAHEMFLTNAWLEK